MRASKFIERCGKPISACAAGLLLALLVFPAPCLAEPSSALRVGSYVPERSIGVSRVIKPWVEAVAAEAGDRLPIDVYWGGSLGKSPSRQFELVASGVLDVAWVLPGYATGQFPQMSLFELPFLFESAEEASVVGWQLYQQGLLEGFDGVRLIGLFTAEPGALFMRQPIGSLDELAGLKIRSLGAIHASWLNLFGAASQTLSAADMNQALYRETLDGAIQGWTGMHTFDSFPLISQAYRIPLGTTPFLVLINARRWNSLTADLKSLLLRHGGLAMARAGGSAYEASGESIRKTLLEQGRVVFSTPDQSDRTRYEQRSEALHRQWAAATPNGEVVYRAARILQQEWRSSRK